MNQYRIMSRHKSVLIHAAYLKGKEIGPASQDFGLLITLLGVGEPCMCASHGIRLYDGLIGSNSWKVSISLTVLLSSLSWGWPLSQAMYSSIHLDQMFLCHLFWSTLAPRNTNQISICEVQCKSGRMQSVQHQWFAHTLKWIYPSNGQPFVISWSRPWIRLRNSLVDSLSALLSIFSRFSEQGHSWLSIWPREAHSLALRGRSGLEEMTDKHLIKVSRRIHSLKNWSASEEER